MPTTRSARVSTDNTDHDGGVRLETAAATSPVPGDRILPSSKKTASVNNSSTATSGPDNEDQNLVGLLQAVTASGDLEDEDIGMLDYESDSDDEIAVASTIQQNSKRKRDSVSEVSSSELSERSSSTLSQPNKLIKTSPTTATSTATVTLPERPAPGTPADTEGQSTEHIWDARAAGVHSAAALFRAASDSSKKYTRPPMSKLFSSLELSPENFLYLQAAAKAYMLDAKHPERENCVGNRGRGDSDMVKLRLHHCVRTFLHEEGHGDKYFGPNSISNETGQVRKATWPRDGDKIIAMCTPLLRRMVTNERQRKYAIESRKGVRLSVDGGIVNNQPTNPQISTNAVAPKTEPGIPYRAPPMAQAAPPLKYPSPATMPVSLVSHGQLHSTGLKVHIFLQAGQPPMTHLLRPKLEFPLSQCKSWKNLRDIILQYTPPPQRDTGSALHGPIKVLTSHGLVEVQNEDHWRGAVKEVAMNVWSEDVVRVIVDVV